MNMYKYPRAKKTKNQVKTKEKNDYFYKKCT